MVILNIFQRIFMFYWMKQKREIIVISYHGVHKVMHLRFMIMMHYYHSSQSISVKRNSNHSCDNFNRMAFIVTHVVMIRELFLIHFLLEVGVHCPSKCHESQRVRRHHNLVVYLLYITHHHNPRRQHQHQRCL